MDGVTAALVSIGISFVASDLSVVVGRENSAGRGTSLRISKD